MQGKQQYSTHMVKANKLMTSWCSGICEHFHACSSGHMRRSTFVRGRQAGFMPNLLIAHLEKIAPPAVLLCEPSPPLASMNNQLM